MGNDEPAWEEERNLRNGRCKLLERPLHHSYIQPLKTDLICLTYSVRRRGKYLGALPCCTRYRITRHPLVCQRTAWTAGPWAGKAGASITLKPWIGQHEVVVTYCSGEGYRITRRPLVCQRTAWTVGPWAGKAGGSITLKPWIGQHEVVVNVLFRRRLSDN
jgi:hypothetical protein